MYASFGSETDPFAFLIARGPEDNLWFTGGTGTIGMIGRINLAGTIDVIVDLPDDNQPNDITAGADGAMWFTEPT
jgi:virginiamycin B lyase